MLTDQLYCGDCVEIMKGLPNDYVDLTLTSPPYDNLRTYNGFNWNFEDTAKELFRITKPGGVVVWVVGDATIKGSETGTSFRQALYFKDIGFNLHDTMIYHKLTPPLTHKRYEQHFEYMFIFVKGKIVTFNPLLEEKKWPDKRLVKQYGKRNKGDTIDFGYASTKITKIKGNVWKYDVGGGKATRDKIASFHPAIFPEQLAHDHIVSWSNPGDLVLDPMCGSGTTCKIAKILGRRYIGIDVSDHYIEIANQRIQSFSAVKGVNSLQVNTVDQSITEEYAMYHGDCVEVTRGLPDSSIHYSIFSPPFSSLYTYSNSERDLGNSRNDGEFFEHFKYLIRELYRVTIPGRLVSFHCMDIPAMKSRDGFIGLKDFPGDLLRMFLAADFIYHSRVAIWKDPLIEATRTKALGLMHKQIVKDSSMCRQGLPDYLITLRKPGINPEPISHPEGFTEFIGENEPEAPRIESTLKDSRIHKTLSMTKVDPVYSHHVWRRYASPVWMDIRQSNTLQYRSAREEKDERHICPLQLDVIARGEELWSNPGDVVFSPFAGIASEGYQAIKMGRRFVGVELKESYYKIAVNNLQMAVQDVIDEMLS